MRTVVMAEGIDFGWKAVQAVAPIQNNLFIALGMSKMI